MTPGANDCFGLRWVSRTVDGKVYKRHHQTPHATERVIVRDIFLLYRDVCANLRKLADVCNANGWVSPSGGKWSASTVGYLLRNEAYIGVGYKNKTHPTRNIRLPKSEWVVVPGAIRPDATGANVVEDDLFATVQTMLSRRSTGGHPRKHGAAYLLGGGHCRCGQCGLTMTGNERGEHDRCAGLRQYVCRNKQVDSPCYHGVGPSVGADKVEQVAWSALVALASDPQRVRASIARLLGEAGPSTDVEQAQVDAIAETEREIANWESALGKLDPDRQASVLLRINDGAAKVRAIKAAMAREHARAAATRGELVELETWLADLQALGGRLDEADALFGVDVAARRDLLERFKIVVWVRKANDARGRFSVRAHVPLPASARLPEEEAGGEELRWEPTNGSCSVGWFPPQPPRAHRHDPLDLAACFPIDLATFVAPIVNDRSSA